MKILFLTTILLSKHCNGGEIASQCIVNTLRALGHEVTVVGYLRRGDAFEHDADNTLIVDERAIETRKSKGDAALWMLLGFFRGLPYSAAKYYSQTYTELVQNLLWEQPYDAVVLDHAQIAWLRRAISPKIPLIAIAHNVERDIYRGNSQTTRNPLSRWIYQREAALIGRQEEGLAIAARQVWTLTQRDAQHFATLVPADQVKILEIPPESKQAAAVLDKGFDIGLLGSWSWQANRDALQWFLETVYPLLPASRSIHVAGKGADWLTEQYPKIVYRGVVPDAQTFMAQSRVVAIPSLSGSGIQIKTLDAIASGSPIVATSVAMRGIDHPPATIQVAETPQDFASAIERVLVAKSENVASEQAKRWYSERKARFVQTMTDALQQLEKSP